MTNQFLKVLLITISQYGKLGTASDEAVPDEALAADDTCLKSDRGLSCSTSALQQSASLRALQKAAAADDDEDRRMMLNHLHGLSLASYLYEEGLRTQSGSLAPLNQRGYQAVAKSSNNSEMAHTSDALSTSWVAL